jgi:hypothetical protein
MSTDTTRLEWEPTGAAVTDATDVSDATDEPSPGADVTDRRPRGTDRRTHASDRPVPRAAHRATVAVLTARAAALEAELEHRQHHHQQVVQRYERLLAEARERASRRREAAAAEDETPSRLRRLFDRLL